MTELVLAIDAGTTGVRSMLFTPTGNVVTKAYEEFESHFPSPSWVEQDAEDWWTSTCRTIKSCFESSSASPNQVVGISVTNQRETVVPIDEKGKPLRRAIVWQDRRTVPQCDWIKEQISEKDIYSTTGLTVNPYFTAPKILWIKRNQPEVFGKTDKFLLVHDYLIYKLTGLTITDHSNASRTMLFDVSKAGWSDKMLDALGIPIHKLPDSVESGTRVGELSEKAAKESGLNIGTPIVAGGGDQQCAALGVGVVRQGSFKSTTGTGTFMLAFTDCLKLDPQRRVLCSRHVVPDSFVLEASMFTTGSALRWFRNQLGSLETEAAQRRGVDPYDILTESASRVPPGSEGVLHIPHFVGAGAPHWNPQARGIFAGLALGHTKAHLIRAILEGVSYEIRSNLEVMRENGVSASEIRVTGGAARSETWMQIQADVIGIPVIRTEMKEATALGAAILAAKGVGLYKSIIDAAERMVKPVKPLTPKPENQDLYNQMYKRFNRLYAAIADLAWDSEMQ
ncbi:MAG: xylulokinase [Candidatus Thorarchaeota archaeon]|jgi:D-xylulose kinase